MAPPIDGPMCFKIALAVNVINFAMMRLMPARQRCMVVPGQTMGMRPSSQAWSASRSTRTPVRYANIRFFSDIKQETIRFDIRFDIFTSNQ